MDKKAKNEMINEDFSMNAGANDDESFDLEMMQDDAAKKSTTNKKLVEGNK